MTQALRPTPRRARTENVGDPPLSALSGVPVGDQHSSQPLQLEPVQLALAASSRGTADQLARVDNADLKEADAAGVPKDLANWITIP